MPSTASKATKLPFKITRDSKRCVSVHMSPTGEGWEQWFLCGADAHVDNKKCDRKLLKKHFEQAVKKKAGVILPGDFYCVMQGKRDKRHEKDDLLPELCGSNYLNRILDLGEDILKPIVPYIVMLGEGNHEQRKRQIEEIDLLEELAKRLGLKERLFNYNGWVRFVFGKYGERKLWWSHGSGGYPPVTKGILQTARRAEAVDADIYLSGHLHTDFSNRTCRRTMEKGREVIRDVLHIQCPSYIRSDNVKGWHAEQEFPPLPVGGVWLIFYIEGGELRMDTRRAL